MPVIPPFFMYKNTLFPYFCRNNFCKLQESAYLCKKFKKEK